MTKIVVANLSIFLTDNCNFKCMHCMRGEQIGINVTSTSLINLFRQTKNVANLSICGGEPFSRPDLLDMLVNIIIEQKVTINEFGIITNGTLYTREIENILKRLNDYALTTPNLVNIGSETKRGHIELSFDSYHQQQLDKIKETSLELYEEYCNNLNILLASPFYEGARDTSGLFNLGRAKQLKLHKTNYRPLPKIYYQRKDIIYYGLLLSMLDDGTISECDGEISLLKEQYNYGNINEESLEDIIKRMSKRVYTMNSFNRKKEKILKWYQTYK